jgi:hypothetical protein
MLRYYSYSEKYRDQLFKIWSGRLLDDYSVYHVDQEAGHLSGALGKRIDVYIGEHDVDNPRYKKTGLLKRSVGLRTSEMHDFHGEVYYTKYFNLNEYNGDWKAKDFRKLLLTEFKYRAEAWIKHRETLDLASPYLLGLSSLLAFAIGLCKQ